MDISRKDPIPEHFNNAEETSRFWDKHSAADYWDHMEEVEMKFDLQKRVYLVPVDERIYYRVKQQAEVEHRSVEQMISAILERELA